jgi:uncharacterized protein
MPLPILSLLETRVLGVLVEKERTVPDSYPLTLNSLVSGCNQKNNRDPMLSATDEEVQVAIDQLKTKSWVVESSGGRVMRYAHNVGRVLRVPEQSVALLATLMLRGPQTAAELRINGERLHKFSDVSAVDGFLDELAARAEDSGGALVVKLPRQAGAREQRWAHLLSGPIDLASLAAAPERATASADVTVAEIATLKAQVATLSDECASLRRDLERVYGELGLTRRV